LTARENLDFFAALDAVPRCIRSQRIDAVLDSVSLSAMADTLVMKYSSGMYQRLGIARALLKRPSLLLLDEPSRSLDHSSAKNLWTLICTLRQQGTTVLLASHNFEEAAAVGNFVSVLREGTLAGQIRLRANITADELRDSYSRLIAGTMTAEAPQHEVEPDYDWATG
jgi:ABC-2 type transport system ATP-binding protein